MTVMASFGILFRFLGLVRKIGLIQFCLSAPKTDMENNVVVSDYAAMDRILREERKYILGLCKKVRGDWNASRRLFSAETDIIMYQEQTKHYSSSRYVETTTETSQLKPKRCIVRGNVRRLRRPGAPSSWCRRAS